MQDLKPWADLGAIGAMIVLVLYLVIKHLPAINAQITVATATFLDAIAKQRGEHLAAQNVQQEKYLLASKESLTAFTQELKEQRQEFLAAMAKQRAEYLATTERQRADSINALNKQTNDFSVMFETTARSLVENVKISILEIMK